MKNSSTSPPSKNDVFQHEVQILLDAQEKGAQKNLSLQDLKSAYKNLISEYKKLLRKSQKITHIGDNNQHKLITAYDRIESQNKELNSARKKAEQADKAKSEFLARMSHEIRTPLNSILGMTELLMLTELDDDRLEYVQTLKEAGQNLLHLVDDILVLLKMEAGGLTLDREDFNLRDVVESTTRMLDVVARQKGLTVKTHISPRVPLFLKGDPMRLRQVLVNMVGNAVKFTSKGKIEIKISLPRGAAGKKDKPKLLFSVKDTGVGIHRDQQSEIFENFKQVDSSSTRRYGGTGLGLPICKQLVELMGGTVSLKSTPGKGSTFSFTALFDPGDKTRAEARHEIEASQKAGHPPLDIILAEDHPATAKIISTFLEREKHHVVHVGNGKELLERLKGENFDLVLMDVEMPEIDGLRAAQFIRADRSGAFDPQIPIIAVTAHTLPGYHDRLLEGGINEVTTKPVNLNKLARRIAAVPRAGQKKRGQNTILNKRAALKRLGGDSELYAKFCKMFLDEIPDINRKLEEDLARQDFESLRKDAHYLKGSAAMIGAERLSRRALDLETMSFKRKGTPCEGEKLFSHINHELTHVKRVLEKSKTRPSI